jgi:predicted nucleic acid-binding Zn ribbon protein
MRNVGEKEKNGKREMNIIAILVVVVVVLWYMD